MNCLRSTCKVAANRFAQWNVGASTVGVVQSSQNPWSVYFCVTRFAMFPAARRVRNLSSLAELPRTQCDGVRMQHAGDHTDSHRCRSGCVEAQLALVEPGLSSSNKLNCASGAIVVAKLNHVEQLLPRAGLQLVWNTFICLSCTCSIKHHE